MLPILQNGLSWLGRSNPTRDGSIIKAVSHDLLMGLAGPTDIMFIGNPYLRVGREQLMDCGASGLEYNV